MQEQFDRILTSLDAGQPVLLAVSGGIDSMCMLNLFLNSSLHVNFAVANCNFHLRGEESDSDSRFVKERAEANGITFFGVDFDTKEYAESKGVSIEMAARDLRYRWFADLALERGYASVAVAHNSNDNAETMMLNLLRGTGVKGMTGMKMKSLLAGSDRIFLIRPLLDFSRKEIAEYAVSHSLKWHEDSSNSDITFKRNCIRNEIFPLFEKVNPSFLSAMSEDAEHFSQVQAIADDFFESARMSVTVPARKGETLRIDLRSLEKVPNFEYVLFRLLDPFGFTRSAIEDICGLAGGDGLPGGRRFISGNFLAFTAGNYLAVTHVSDQAGKAEGVSKWFETIESPGDYSFAGISLAVTQEEYSLNLDLHQPDASVIFDSGKIPFPFKVRHWHEGDWMRPLGLKSRSGEPGRKKLSDLFVDLGFSLLDKREALVIAGEGSHVLVLLGFRIDESVKVSRSTASVTRIRII